MAVEERFTLPDGRVVDLTSIPVFQSNMLFARTGEGVIVVSFLADEQPFPICVARIAIPDDLVVGFAGNLLEHAHRKGLVSRTHLEDEGGKQTAH